MAQTILQQPTTPNGTLSNLMYVVSSSNANTKPQFRYIAQVQFSGSSDVLYESKIFPNSASSGVFDLAHIYNDYLSLDVDLNTLTITGSNASGSAKFVVRFGEEYGTSLSSSTTEYFSQSTSNPIIVVPTKVNPDYGSYNYDSSSLGEVNALTSFPFYQGNVFDKAEIDNMKTVSYTGDYETLQVLNYNSNPLQINEVIVANYDVNGNFLSDFDLTGSFPQDTLLSVYVGPQNFLDKGGIYQTQFEEDWYYYRVSLVDNSGSFENYWYKRNDGCETYKTRFVWLNDLGGWEFFNAYVYDSKSTSVKRQTYTQNFASYSGRNPQYNIESRGKTNYYTSYQDEFNIVSDWLTTNEANWLGTIFESNDVYVQSGSLFLPINIKNASYAWKTNPKGQKIFQYDFNYEYSNKRQSR